MIQGADTGLGCDLTSAVERQGSPYCGRDLGCLQTTFLSRVHSAVRGAQGA